MCRPAGDERRLPLDAEINKTFDPAINRRLCLLAVDGNSFPSNFAYGLLRSQAMLRVGGFNADLPTAAQRRRSSYQWFEQLLVPGRHYLRADLDDLEATLRTLPDKSTLEAIAHAGRAAALDLFSAKSTQCYATLSMSAYAAGQQALIEAALAQPHRWQAIKLDPANIFRCPQKRTSHKHAVSTNPTHAWWHNITSATGIWWGERSELAPPESTWKQMHTLYFRNQNWSLERHEQRDYFCRCHSSNVSDPTVRKFMLSAYASLDSGRCLRGRYFKWLWKERWWSQMPLSSLLLLPHSESVRVHALRSS